MLKNLLLMTIFSLSLLSGTQINANATPVCGAAKTQTTGNIYPDCTSLDFWDEQASESFVSILTPEHRPANAEIVSITASETCSPGFQKIMVEGNPRCFAFEEHDVYTVSTYPDAAFADYSPSSDYFGSKFPGWAVCDRVLYEGTFNICRWKPGDQIPVPVSSMDEDGFFPPGACADPMGCWEEVEHADGDVSQNIYTPQGKIIPSYSEWNDYTGGSLIDQSECISISLSNSVLTCKTSSTLSSRDVLTARPSSPGICSEKNGCWEQIVHEYLMEKKFIPYGKATPAYTNWVDRTQAELADSLNFDLCQAMLNDNDGNFVCTTISSIQYQDLFQKPCAERNGCWEQNEYEEGDITQNIYTPEGDTVAAYAEWDDYTGGSLIDQSKCDEITIIGNKVRCKTFPGANVLVSDKPAIVTPSEIANTPDLPSLMDFVECQDGVFAYDRQGCVTAGSEAVETSSVITELDITLEPEIFYSIDHDAFQPDPVEWSCPEYYRKEGLECVLIHPSRKPTISDLARKVDDRDSVSETVALGQCSRKNSGECVDVHSPQPQQVLLIIPDIDGVSTPENPLFGGRTCNSLNGVLVDGGCLPDGELMQGDQPQRRQPNEQRWTINRQKPPVITDIKVEHLSTPEMVNSVPEVIKEPVELVYTSSDFQPQQVEWSCPEYHKKEGLDCVPVSDDAGVDNIPDINNAHDGSITVSRLCMPQADSAREGNTENCVSVTNLNPSAHGVVTETNVANNAINPTHNCPPVFGYYYQEEQDKCFHQYIANGKLVTEEVPVIINDHNGAGHTGEIDSVSGVTPEPVELVSTSSDFQPQQVEWSCPEYHKKEGLDCVPVRGDTNEANFDVMTIETEIVDESVSETNIEPVELVSTSSDFQPQQVEWSCPEYHKKEGLDCVPVRGDTNEANFDVMTIETEIVDESVSETNIEPIELVYTAADLQLQFDESVSETTVETEVVDENASETTGETEIVDESISETTVETEVVDEGASETTGETEVVDEDASETTGETEVVDEDASETTGETEVVDEDVSDNFPGEPFEIATFSLHDKIWMNQMAENVRISDEAQQMLLAGCSDRTLAWVDIQSRLAKQYSSYSVQGAVGDCFMDTFVVGAEFDVTSGTYGGQNRQSIVAGPFITYMPNQYISFSLKAQGGALWQTDKKRTKSPLISSSLLEGIFSFDMSDYAFVGILQGAVHGYIPLDKHTAIVPHVALNSVHLGMPNSMQTAIAGLSLVQNFNKAYLKLGVEAVQPFQYIFDGWHLGKTKYRYYAETHMRASDNVSIMLKAFAYSRTEYGIQGGISFKF